MSLHIDSNRLLLDGKPVQIIGGAMHYFRIHPDLWGDRLLKARQCGLNTITTYCCWNLHEPREGEFRFTDELDVARYIRLAGELGLHVIVRPGPFICSEWDLGGLPAWLQTKDGMRLRSLNAPFLKATNAFFDQLLPRLAPLQHTRGGPIIAMQVENEYGGFGSDTAYLEAVRDSLVEHDIDVLLLTSDGASKRMLRDGAIPGHLQTVNFRSNPKRAFAMVQELFPGTPNVAMEYWSGKGKLWEEPFWRHKVEDVVLETEWMLQHGASLSFYMFHGGTSFGFMSGARIQSEKYRAQLTSYDVDALLNEAGDPTPKYFAVQKVIAACCPDAQVAEPTVATKAAYGTVPLEACAPLFASLPALSTPVADSAPLRMEDLGQAYGFVLYRTTIAAGQGGRLELCELRDRAQLFLDGKPLGTVYRNDPETALELPAATTDRRLDILVENMGRVNCGGENIFDSFKGILGGVQLDGEPVLDWENYALPLDDLDGLAFEPAITGIETPAFYRGTFVVEEAADTFLKVGAGSKGICWINGFNLGRYWEVGPQHTLYIPAPLLRQGENEIVVFELHNLKTLQAELVDALEFSDQRDLDL